MSARGRSSWEGEVLMSGEVKGGVFSHVLLNGLVLIMMGAAGGGRAEVAAPPLELRWRQAAQTAWLGVAWKEYGTTLAVAAVHPGSPAAQAKFEVGETLVAVEKKMVASPREFEQVISAYATGSRVAVEVACGGERIRRWLSVPSPSWDLAQAAKRTRRIDDKGDEFLMMDDRPWSGSKFFWYPGGGQLNEEKVYRDGRWVMGRHWYQNGQLWSENPVGLAGGPVRKWYENGQLREEGQEKKSEPDRSAWYLWNPLRVGSWISYWPNGQVKRKAVYGEDGSPASPFSLWDESGRAILPTPPAQLKMGRGGRADPSYLNFEWSFVSGDRMYCEGIPYTGERIEETFREKWKKITIYKDGLPVVDITYLDNQGRRVSKDAFDNMNRQE